jgi:protein-tyrosine phosphatase
MLREVTLPAAISGRLFLAAMPGRYGPFEEERRAIVDSRVDVVICLTTVEEARLKSPDYARAIEAGGLPWESRMFGIPDFGLPEDREAYLALVKSAAADLEAGRRILVHCGAGIGRTGTFAAGVLMALGMGREDALECVRRAGSHPETPEQRDLVRWVGGQLEGDTS